MFATLIVRVTLISRFFLNREIREINAKISCNKVCESLDHFCVLCILQAAFQSPPLVMQSPGRSGAKFFISKNKKFYVKTIESEDIERLHNILPQYHHVSC